MSTETFLKQLQEKDPGRLRRPPRSAASYVDQLKRARTFKQPSRLERFRKAWRAAAGEEIAANSDVASYKEGELRISVESKALAHELSVFRAQELCEAVNRELKDSDRVARLSFSTRRAIKRTAEKDTSSERE